MPLVSSAGMREVADRRPALGGRSIGPIRYTNGWSGRMYHPAPVTLDEVSVPGTA
jgi:hypothetical protein